MKVGVLAVQGAFIEHEKVLENDPDKHLQTLPVTVKRNAYGRQLGSFVTTKDVGEIPDFPHIFIRAPYITKAPEGAKILSVVEDRIVGVEYKNQLAFAFHQEMTDDPRLHELFLKKI